MYNRYFIYIYIYVYILGLSIYSMYVYIYVCITYTHISYIYIVNIVILEERDNDWTYGYVSKPWCGPLRTSTNFWVFLESCPNSHMDIYGPMGSVNLHGTVSKCETPIPSRMVPSFLSHQMLKKKGVSQPAMSRWLSHWFPQLATSWYITGIAYLIYLNKMQRIHIHIYIYITCIFYLIYKQFATSCVYIYIYSHLYLRYPRYGTSLKMWPSQISWWSPLLPWRGENTPPYPWHAWPLPRLPPPRHPLRPWPGWRSMEKRTV